MHKWHKIISIIIFLIVVLLTYIFKIHIDEQLTSDLLTVVSIMLGFTLTSISTLIGQDFTKKLRNEIDTNTDRKQTQLQTLSVYYKVSFLLGIIIIISLVSIRFLPSCSLLKKIYDSIVLGCNADNFYISYLLIKILIRSLREVK
ncbi:hypothetical protein MSI_26600 [Treponema sp. JC4]|nr:hypothetical protein MSI_26600 [Treponema sp. JC4]